MVYLYIYLLTSAPNYHTHQASNMVDITYSIDNFSYNYNILSISFKNETE